MQQPWFSTKGQIVQTVLAAIALIFAGVKAWPELQKSAYFSGGAILFYLICAVMIASVGVLVNAIRNASHRPASAAAPPAVPRIELMEVQVSFDPTAIYKLKIRPQFRNITGDCIDVRVLQWKPAAIRAKSPFSRDTLQWKSRGRWQPEGKTSDEVHVPDGDFFHLWISPDDQHSQGEVERARDQKILGTLVLSVSGRDFEVQL